MSVAPGRVEMLINGNVLRSLRPGESSPEGVRLVEVRDGLALVEVDGRRWQMRLGSRTASSVVLQADARGHFLVDAAVNGVPLRALVDTGASAISMNLSDAQRAGVSFTAMRRITVLTAAGPRPALLVRLASVQVGDIVLDNVEAAISEGNDLPITLLGMSFLNQLEMQRSGRILTLIQRH